ncbi:MAG: ABC transporter permease [Bryobacteraceae bacterium]
MTIRRLLARLHAMFRKPALDLDLDHEIEAHLEQAERDAVAAGHPPEEARRLARRRFGAIEEIKEEHREARGVLWLEDAARDFRHGLRLLARSPGFSAAVIGVLALGVGANVAVFGLLQATLLKPLPFPDADRIVRLWEEPRPGAANSTSSLDFLDWRRLARSFSAMSAETRIRVALTGAGDPVQLAGKAVTAGYFRVFPVTPALGRTFAAGEDEPGAAPVAILSFAAWQGIFGADPKILHRRVNLDGVPHEIVGVLPPTFADSEPIEIWKPLAFTPDRRERSFHWLLVHARLAPGVTLEAARAEMQSIHASLQTIQLAFKRDWKIAMDRLENRLVGPDQRRAMWITFGAVVLVLLIACANVGNLVLARGAARRREIAVRAALGASRARLLTQSLAESLSYCLLGSAAGLGAAYAIIHTAAAFLVTPVAYKAPPSFDCPMFAFAGAIALAITVGIGVIPFLRATLVDLARSLHAGGRGSSASDLSTRRILVVSEVALSLILVSGALLLLRSLHNLQNAETGIRTANVTTASVDLPPASYPTPRKAARFYEAFEERLKAIPGVESAALSAVLPLQWVGDGEGMMIAGVPGFINVRFKQTGPGYFATVGMPILAGRAIAAGDDASAPRIVVVNETLAARLAETAGWKDPIGRSVRLTTPRYIERGGTLETVQIAGIVRDERTAAPGAPGPPVAYVPLAQAPAGSVHAIVRSTPGAPPPAGEVRGVLAQVDPDLPLGATATVEEIRSRNFAGQRRPAWLIGVFAGIAALLAAVGLFGVLSQSVAQRRREIGIRMALGARRAQVTSTVIRAAGTMIAAGLAIGLAGSAAISTTMRNLVYGVSPLDPLGLGAACALMVIIGLAAALIPASRAARVDPVRSLREE